MLIERKPEKSENKGSAENFSRPRRRAILRPGPEGKLRAMEQRRQAQTLKQGKSGEHHRTRSVAEIKLKFVFLVAFPRAFYRAAVNDCGKIFPHYVQPVVNYEELGLAVKFKLRLQPPQISLLGSFIFLQSLSFTHGNRGAQTVGVVYQRNGVNSPKP